MYREEIQKVGSTAASKRNLLRNQPVAYFLQSMLAGAFIGIGVLLAFTIGGQLSAADSPAYKIAMGLSFGIALSLVVMAGGELFTGNNFVMSVGIMRKTVSVGDAVLLWVVCWIGNLAGAWLLAILYHFTGLGTGDVGSFMASSALTKMTLPAGQLFIRGMLCNFLVCLAVWCGTRLQSEIGKLLMIFWCLFAFITVGFEHSIANMTLMAISLLNPMDTAVSIGGYCYNLLIVTFGNMVGGILFVAVPYAIAARSPKSEN